MARSALLLNILALAALTVLPVSAKVLAEGKPSKDFYWQKVEQKSGKVVYLCRSEASSKFQKNDRCEGAGAVKPK
jgi:hypothetical protein